MKHTFLLFTSGLFLFSSGCKKEDTNENESATVTSAEVLNDFAHSLALPNYNDIRTKANALKTSVDQLESSPTDANLAQARNAWRETRKAWEQAEGFLFGPVEDFDYDPAMDDWPVNKVDLDSLLISNNSLTLSDIDLLPTSLKGFHPIEYLIFGIGGNKTASQITVREMKYLASLTQSLFNTTNALYNSWDTGQTGNFTDELLSAGSGSSRFATRKEAFITIASAMAGICDEVANGKMEVPLAAQDSTLEESQFSHNSTADFKNNIIGVKNVYFGNYISDGIGLNEIVKSKNLSLHNKLQSQITTAISSLNSIDANYGAAIYYQQFQVRNAQDAINALKTTIENDLMNFIHSNITD